MDTIRVVPRTIRPIALDRFEVTVGRFRSFKVSYDREGHPTAGQGTHPAFPDSGWREEWDGKQGTLPATDTVLTGNLRAQQQVFNDEIDDRLPVRGVSWYVAFAFCIWDGGRLPTEAEWAYAAFGGQDDREYPWSVDRTAPNHDLACYSDTYGMLHEPVPVGSFPAGRGRFGHDDLAGNVEEWVMDTHADELPLECSSDQTRAIDSHECLVSEDRARRVVRGASFIKDASWLRNPQRTWHNADGAVPWLGFRCAHDVGMRDTPP